MTTKPLISASHAFDLREFIGLRAGYSDLFGGRTTWANLRDDLSQYTLAEVLDMVGRISAVLDNSRGDAELQTAVARGLLGPAAEDVLRRVRDFGRVTKNRHIVLFEPLQLVSLTKAAFLFLSPTGGLRGDINYLRLAHALLRMNDLVAWRDFEGLDPETHRQEWIKYFFAMGVFYRGGHDLHEIARFHQLCLRPHEDLSSAPDYLDFSALATSATGLSVDLLWLGLTALTAQWKALDLKKAGSGSVFIDEANFLSANFHFSREEQDKIFAIATLNAEAMHSRISGEYREDNFRPFDFVPLADKPLIRVGDRVFCASTPLLSSKLSDGLYYLLANSVTGAQRDRFSRFLGTVFEQYVVELLRRMLDARRPIFIEGSTLREAVCRSGKDGIKVADCLIVLDGIALVIESKARFFARGARTGESFEAISARITDVFSRGARQLESTIELAESGALEQFGVRPGDVKAYVPLVVCLDETPLAPPVYDLITPVKPARGLDKTESLQVVGVSELEQLEDAVARGALNVHALLGYKARAGRHAESLRNTVLGDPSLRGFSVHSPFLARVYNEQMASALTTLRLRQK